MGNPLDRLRKGGGKKRSAYKDAGVDIDAQDRALDKVKELVAKTRTAGVLSEVGGFGGLFRPDLSECADPVLVASSDGVGTKLEVARRAGDFSTVGRDLVNHCVNDILVQGALPLFFLDYVGAGKIEPDSMVELVRGVADGCRENGCALLGGETAEMPGFYREGDYELAGFIVGLVDRAAILDGSRVAAGDVLVGLPSAGLHTNGYSLARRVVFEKLGLEPGDPAPWVSRGRRSVADELLAPHLSYLKPLKPLLRHPGLHALAHVTGGGLTDNLPRVLPPDTHAVVRFGAWEVPEIFPFLQDEGEVDDDEMLRVFNMGIGMVAIVERDALGEILASLRASEQRSFVIGKVDKGGSGVSYDLERSGELADADGGEG
ncbi:MAG TPA: phosphoribosylformylglycinamidine cyclo-ligase [Thermoanaerobaculia bacterium]|nr:phosphoribosylformylglycinamidine cyclo-ligase [Thermoanaerobaculia bacterium]